MGRAGICLQGSLGDAGVAPGSARAEGDADSAIETLEQAVDAARVVAFDACYL